MLIHLCSHIASKPLAKTGNALIDADNRKTKPKDANRGFQTADDGRLIIAEPRRSGKRGAAADDDDESDNDFDMDGGEAAEKRLGTKKRSLADDSDDSDAEDDDAAAGAPSRKRAMLGAASMASGRTGASSRYVAGGRGIHRPTGGGAASVRSGVSAATTAARSTGGASQSTAFGGSFKAKKAGGDVKKGKLDPYAYIPLSRTSMNKR